MTSIIHDYAAIRQRSAIDPPTETGTTLAELIEEERRAWNAETALRNPADEAWFAWRAEHPGAVDPEDPYADEDDPNRPAHIAALYAEADLALVAADDLTHRVACWIPESLADAIRLLEWNSHERRVLESILAALKIIAGAGGPVTTAPVTGDRRIIGLLSEWLVRVRWANRPGDRSDAAIDADCEPVRAIEDAITETPAEGATGLAVKVFLSAYYEGEGDDCALAPSESMSDNTRSLLQDIARLVPELAPLCAPALAEDKQP